MSFAAWDPGIEIGFPHVASAVIGGALLLYALFRKRAPGEPEPKTEAVVPLAFGRRFPWIGCFILLTLLVVVGFAYIFLKHVVLR